MSQYCPSTQRDGDVQSEKLLVEAATIGDITTVTSLLQMGVSVDSVEYNKALFYASKNYMTPLQMAATNGFLNCVELLINRGADVNAKDRFDVTALHMAAEKGHCSSLKALLNAYAECSLPTKYSKSGCYTAVPHLGGTTPLHLAAANNNTDCVKELIQYGADYNAADERGRTSLYIAAQSGFSDCVLAHLRNAAGRDILSLPSFQSSDTPLHFAVSRGMIECVKELLISGSDVNHLNYNGYSPLHLTVTPLNEDKTYTMEILEMLVLNGFNTNINQPDGSNLSPLHYVCFNGKNALRQQMAKFLISYGADINIKNARGCGLLEFELKSTFKENEVLRYIVRSMRHLPKLAALRITPQIALIQSQEIIQNMHPTDNMHHFETVPTYPSIFRRPDSFRVEPVLQTRRIVYEIDTDKQIWYESIATNPRTLQHYCRYTIRQALGSRSMKFIHQLPVPKVMQSYLLLEFDD